MKKSPCIRTGHAEKRFFREVADPALDGTQLLEHTPLNTLSINKNVILRFWQDRIRGNEHDHLIVGAAEHRLF